MSDDPMKRPVSRELEMLLPMIAHIMKYSTQALSQSTALAEVLIAKGVVTKQELDAAMSVNQKMKDTLMEVLNKEIRKQS